METDKLKAEAEKDIAKFKETLKKYNLFTDKLIEFLGDDLYTAPATPNSKQYCSYPSGLIHHILTLSKYAVKINEILPDASKIEITSLLKVCFISQIGRVRLFKFNDSDWGQKQGMIYSYNNDLVPMKIGERSAYYAISNGVVLTEDEYSAIISHDKDLSEDSQTKYYSPVISVILRQAIELTIKEHESKLNN